METTKARKYGALLTVLSLFQAMAPPAAAVETTYQDIPSGAWYAEAAAYCAEKGLMTGTDTAHFTPGGPLTQSMTADWDGGAGIGCTESSPNQPLTREELIYLLWQKGGSPSCTEELSFTDAPQVSSECSEAAAWAAASGLVVGRPDGQLDPQAAVTRAEAAAILMRRDLTGLGQTEAAGRSVTDESLGASGIASMEDGSFLVTDLYNKKIWRITNGKAEVYAGGDTVKDSGGQPVGGFHDAGLLESYFSEPWAIAPYGDGWVVSDAGNNALRQLSGQNVKTLKRDLSHPTGLAADGAGNVYISDTFSGTIRKMDARGTFTIAASGLNDPMGLCWKDGVLYIAETGANRVSKLEDGKVTVIAGSDESGSADGAVSTAEFSAPKAVAAASDGTIYVADSGNSAIRRIRDGWVSTTAARDYGAGDLRLIAPGGLLLQDGNLLVCDSFARTVMEFTVD